MHAGRQNTNTYRVKINSKKIRKLCVYVWMNVYVYAHTHIYIIYIWTCLTEVETNSVIENNWTKLWAFHQENTQIVTKHMKNTWRCNPLKDWKVKIPINILPLLWFIYLKSVGYGNAQFIVIKWCGQFLKEQVCMAQQFPASSATPVNESLCLHDEPKYSQQHSSL